MSLGLLGDGFDLHGGGDDLVFPHHTNERAEAVAAGRPFAQHWLHNAMLNVGGEKMAKSLGNFRTVRDLLDGHPLNARALRLLLLQTHYRKTMEVNAEVMTQARAGIERIDAMARRANAAGISLDGTKRDTASLEAFASAMDNDLGTPEAIAVIFDNGSKSQHSPRRKPHQRYRRSCFFGCHRDRSGWSARYRSRRTSWHWTR